MAFIELVLIASAIGFVMPAFPCPDRPMLPPNTHEYFPGSLQAPIKSPPYPNDHAMYFHCNNDEGFVDANMPWWKNLLTCKNGTWIRNYESNGAVVCKRSQCGAGQRICPTGKCIDASKWCDCLPDCDQGEDERNCGAIKVDTTGKKSGSIRKMFFAGGYPRNIDCTLNITTVPGKRLDITFPTVDLGGTSGSMCRDYISLSHVEYGKQVLCFDADCPICNKLDFDVKSKGNWFGIRLVSKGDSPGNTGVIIDWKLARNAKKSGGGGTIYFIGGVVTIIFIISGIVIFAVVKLRKRRSGVPHARFM